jgi:hypothetical protein
MRFPQKREALKQLAVVCSATELQLANSTRDFRKELVRDANYKALLRTVLGLVYTGMAQALTTNKEEAKELLKAVRDDVAA